MTHTHIVVKLKVPEDVAADGPEAIDDWLNSLDYQFVDPNGAEYMDGTPGASSDVETEIVENQFPYPG